jgi:quercetin dioxygenase-like cupin family protein
MINVRSVAFAAFILSALLGSSLAQPKKEPPAAAPPSPAAHPGHVILAPSDIKWTDAPPFLPKGAKMMVLIGNPGETGLFTVRLKMPAGYKIPAHNHPTDEHVTVLKGSFGLGMGDVLDQKKGKVLGVGGYAALPKGMNHFAWAKGETIVQVHAMGPFAITYVNPADDPRNAPAAPAPKK